MIRPFDIRDLGQLALDLIRPAAGAELGVLILCLIVAWVVVRLVRGPTVPQDSVWFGRRIVDGVLFPVLALALALVARVALETVIRPAVFRVAIPILVSLVIIRLSVRVLTGTFPNVGWMRTVERSISWLTWMAVVLWVTGLTPMLLDAMGTVQWKIGSVEVTLRNVVEGTITAGIVIVLVLWAANGFERLLLRHATGQQLSLRKIAAALVRSVLLFAGLMFALSAVGIDLRALSVLGGAIGVGVGFGLQKIAANYMSGFIILAERSVRIGDMVRVDTFEGRITDIRTRYTVIRSLGGREAIVPNEMLITTRVENLSLADPRVMVQTGVQVAYGTDVPALQPKLEAAIAAVARVVSDPAPGVQLATFSADGMDLVVNFWIRDSENGQGNVKSAVNLAILKVLEAEGVEIPFPQRVVHATISRVHPGSGEEEGVLPSPSGTSHRA
jgi:small-conductance mechanosensitive channel